MRIARAAVAALLLCECSSSSSPRPGVPYFTEVMSAPADIQSAAAAVVLVEIPGASATGSFISPDGLLLTNNHVLGVGVCPVEGCYAQLTWGFQRGKPLPKPVTVFVLPRAVDIGLDMAVMQVSDSPGGTAMTTPSYLTIDAQQPAALLGTHVNIVGHPQGSVKKWSSGEVAYSDGSWIWTTAFDLPGSSGSPILDDHGHLVGLVHRGPEGVNLATRQDVNAFSIGTASAALVAAFGNPLPSSIVSESAPTTEAQVALHQLVYLAAHSTTALVDGSQESVLDILGRACDAGLARTDYASPDDLTAGLQPCFDAENWIDCRSDSMAPFAVCPTSMDVWNKRYRGVFEYWRRFNGQLDLDEMSFAEAALSSDMTGGRASGAAFLMQALSEASPALDFHVAEHLAAFQIETYEGQSVVDFVSNYQSVPDYALNGVDLVSTILWLGNLGEMDTSESALLLATLHADANIDVGTKLFIEEAQYYRGLLP